MAMRHGRKRLVTFSLPPALLEPLDALARKEFRSRSSMIEKIIHASLTEFRTVREVKSPAGDGNGGRP